jgi:hypothetical protein
MKLPIIMLAVMALAGCAEIPKDVSSMQQPSRTISFNGIVFKETTESSFNIGRFQNLPRVRTMGDLAALDSAIMSYAEIQKRAARKGDWETMMTARHLGMLLVEYRAYVTGSSLQAIGSIKKGQDDSAVMTIPAGGYAVLPYKLGSNPVRSRASMEKALMQLMEASLNKNFEHGDAVYVATNLQKVIKTISDIQQPIYRSPDPVRSGVISASSLPTMTDMIPMNRPFIVSEPGGNRYVLERTEDAWVINNPSGENMKIQVERLGYAPEFKGYDADMAAAVSLATRISDQGTRLLVEAGGAGLCFTAKPNSYSCVGEVFRVAENGMLLKNDTTTSQDRTYEKKPPYSIAMELDGAWRFSEPVFVSFKNACSSSGNPIVRSTFGGNGELYTISCLDQKGSPQYSRQYYISLENKQMVQTIGSVLEDSKNREKIEKALAPEKLLEGFAQFVPGLGTADSLAQCAGADSFTQDVYLWFASSSVREQVRLDSFLSEPESIGSRTLDCLAGLSSASGAIKAARWMSGWLNVSAKQGAELSASLKVALDSDRMKKVEELSRKFGNDWVSGKDVTDAINAMKAGNVGGASIKMAETFYSATQAGKSMSDLTEAATGVLNNNDVQHAKP